MDNKAGIYKITSPTGKVYIGQSVNLKRRMNMYRRMDCVKQRKIYASIAKYGWDNHRIEIIHELPSDVSIDVLNSYEKLYIEKHKDCGLTLLNITDGGNNASHVVTEETRAKIRAARVKQVIAKGRKATEESKIKMSESAKRRGNNLPSGFSHSKESKSKISIAKKGQVSHNKGMHLSDEWKKKLSQAKIGKTGAMCPNSKKVLCTKTWKVYDSAGLAASALGISRATLSNILLGKSNTSTTLTYLK